jgi:hypothetical protein
VDIGGRKKEKEFYRPRPALVDCKFSNYFIVKTEFDCLGFGIEMRYSTVALPK